MLGATKVTIRDTAMKKDLWFTPPTGIVGLDVTKANTWLVFSLWKDNHIATFVIRYCLAKQHSPINQNPQNILNYCFNCCKCIKQRLSQCSTWFGFKPPCPQKLLTIKSERCGWYDGNTSNDSQKKGGPNIIRNTKRKNRLRAPHVNVYLRVSTSSTTVSDWNSMPWSPLSASGKELQQALTTHYNLYSFTKNTKGTIWKKKTTNILIVRTKNNSQYCHFHINKMPFHNGISLFGRPQQRHPLASRWMVGILPGDLQ